MPQLKCRYCDKKRCTEKCPGNTVCEQCGRRGHDKGECPTLHPCKECGRTDHREKSCKFLLLKCDRCGGKGHVEQQCRIPICNFCHKPGHFATKCSENNCDRCGNNGHQAHECRTKMCGRCKTLSEIFPSLSGLHHVDEDCKVCEKCGAWHLPNPCKECQNCGGFGHIVTGCFSRAQHQCQVCNKWNYVPNCPSCAAGAGPTRLPVREIRCKMCKGPHHIKDCETFAKYECKRCKAVGEHFTSDCIKPYCPMCKANHDYTKCRFFKKEYVCQGCGEVGVHLSRECDSPYLTQNVNQVADVIVKFSDAESYHRFTKPPQAAAEEEEEDDVEEDYDDEDEDDDEDYDDEE